MKTFRFCCLALFVFAISQLCVGQNYNAKDIKPALTKNANAVFRLFEMNYVIKDTGKSVLTCHYIITVLNSKGDYFAEFEEYYDQFSKIEDLNGKIYNDMGGIIKKVKTSDFSDLSAVSNYSIYDDNRLKYLKPLVSSYPYTVEYEYSASYDGFINIPSWNPQSYYDLSIEKAIYNVTTPKNLNIRFMPVNEAKAPTITENTTTKTFHLEIDSLPAIEKEVLSSGLQDVVQIGFFIPEYFKIGGLSCKNDSWKNFGLFFNQLNKLPNQLSEKTVSDLKEIQNKAKSKKELVKLVYEYMQSKTRYVSIQLGIGGLQPFDASIVDKYGYGDCKALTNYTKALLGNVGIPSIYTLVKATKYAPNIFTNESFNQFNHAILCVPVERDTVWLECTSQTIPFGFLGSFTDNRNVLLITDKGGIITKTKYYNQELNQQKRTCEVQIMPDGKAVAKMNTRFTGLQYDDNKDLLYQNPDNQKESLYEEIKLPTFTINSYKLTEERSDLPVLNLDMDLTATKYATTMGNRLLLPLNMLNRRQPISDVNKERKAKMRIRYAYIDSDSILYHIPEGYTVESIPQNVEIKSVFGNYSYKIISNSDQNSIKYVRELKINDGIYPAEQFKEYVAFIKGISAYDNVKVSLIHKI